jgi:hypothetical protein
MPDTPEQNTGTPAPEEVTGQTQAAAAAPPEAAATPEAAAPAAATPQPDAAPAAAEAQPAVVQATAAPAPAPAADEAPTAVQPAVAPPAGPTPPAQPVAVAGARKRPWWHYAVGAAVAAAILVGVFLGGVAVGKNSHGSFDRHGFAQAMPYGNGQNGQGGRQLPYGQGDQGGQGWGDNGTSPHGWDQQGGQGYDPDGDDWGGRQGTPSAPSPAPSIQSQ